MLYIYTHARLLNDRDLRARAEFHYTPLTSHVQGAEAPGTGLTRDMMDLSTPQNGHSEGVLKQIAKKDNSSMHTYYTNPPPSVKQHLQQWLSKCCTKLLTKKLKHLCTRTELDVKARYALHALTPTENKTNMVSTNNTHAIKNTNKQSLLKKNQPAASRAVKTALQRVFYKKPNSRIPGMLAQRKSPSSVL